MTDVKIAFVVVHAGREDPDSRKILEEIESSGVNSISCIEVGDEKTKQLLETNTKGVKITQLPAILVAQTGEPTLVYPGQAIHQILSTIREMVIDT